MKKGLLLSLILCFVISLTAFGQGTLPSGVNDGLGTLGLDTNLKYQVATADMNSTGSAMVIGEWKDFDKSEKMTGLYAVRQVLDAGYSDYVFAYAYGDLDERQNILDLSPDGKHYATCRDTNDGADTDLFYPAMWSGNVSPSGSLGSDTIFAHQQIYLTTYYDAKVALDAMKESDDGYAAALAKVNEEASKLLKASDGIRYKYAFDREGVIKVNELDKFTTRFFCNNATFKTKTLTTKFVAYVSDITGKITKYSKSYTQAFASSFDATFTFSDFIPQTDAFLVAFEFYPNTDNPADNLVEASSGAFRYATWFKTNSYVIKAPATLPCEKPVLSLTTRNAVITVDNYKENAAYAYSCDGGITFTSFEGSSFYATKASTNYVVKVLANEYYLASETSEPVTTPPITVVGKSLVLDGRIGIKIYMDIDTEIISNPNFYMTRVNNDYTCSEGDENYPLYRKGGAASFNTSTTWCDKITYDSENELYYTIIYIPAKDVDNVRVECDLGGYPNNQNTRVSYSNMGGSITFGSYITSAIEKAEAGEEEFVKVIDLIKALDNYTKYADNYFKNGSLESYSSSKLNEINTAEPTRSTTSPEGIRFNSTALVLEDTVTIRHYFKVIDLDAFIKNYTCDIPYGVKDEFIYFDIGGITADEFTTKKTLTIKNPKGEDYKIEFSVLDYIRIAKGNSNSRLVSLINAMYDYYLETKNYLKPKPLYLSYDKSIYYESAKGGLNIYIPTKEGYINHLFSRTVSTDRNADVWRLSRAFGVDDKLENPVQLTVDNAEWDMALKIVGRPDFVGGWMHGDEIMTDIKFVIDGIEKDVTTLTEVIAFETLSITENSIGYDPSNPTTAAFKHKKIYTIDHSGIKLEQRVEWLNDYQVEYSYLAMMPPKKEYTDSYYTNLNTTPKTINLSSGSINVSGATSVTVFGKIKCYV